MEPSHTLSHYRLLEKLGEGGMGVVWKAEDTVLGRTVAVKVLPTEVSRSEERRAMFLEEARLASSLSDAHIAQVHEFGQEGDLDFIVMEYVEGKPLSKILHGRPLPPDKVVALGMQVARALARAHRKGLIHRDLKPSNLLVTPEGDVKVVDFGLATLFERRESTHGSDETTRTAIPAPGEAAGQGASRRGPARAGTLPYMSPEQVRGDKLDARSDIFSLGAVLYEMTTGQRPFGGATSADLVQEIVKARVRPPHELVAKLPLELDRIVQKALGARREDRYQTMDDLAVDMKRLDRELESGSAPSYEDLDQLLARGWRRRFRFAAGSGLAAVLAVALGAWWLASNRSAKLDERKVLVLPFEVSGQAEGAEYAGLAFAEGLAIHIAQAKDLEVLPVQESKGGTAPSPKARLAMAADQNAGILLMGRLVRDRDAVQASVQLLDSRSGRIRWGAQQSAQHGDLSGLASSLARQALASLGAAPRKIYEHPFHQTGDPEIANSPIAAEAIGAYNRGDYVSAMPVAVKLVEAFPRSVEARAVQCFILQDDLIGDPSARNRKAMEDCISALDALDPSNPFSSIVRAWVLLRIEGRNREAIDTLTRVISRSDLGPSLRAEAFGRRGACESRLGDHEAALKDVQDAIDLDPTVSSLYTSLSDVLRGAGRPEEALVRARQALALDPFNWSSWQQASFALGDLGRNEESLPYRSKACELSGAQEPCASLAIALQRLGRGTDARAAAQHAARLPTTFYGAYNLACYHALAGERRDALASLRRALDLGFTDAWLEKDPDFASLRGDPEFEAMTAEVKRRISTK